MNRVRRIVIVLVAVSALPASAFAQATLSGVVKDISGGVLPGTTVEVSSPALIEKTRTAVSDATGQYRLTELPPGTYAVTFTLTGFNTVRREGVEVTGAGVITINADMKVGSVSETITVTGETPVVGVQKRDAAGGAEHGRHQTLPSPAATTPFSLAVPPDRRQPRRDADAHDADPPRTAGVATKATCRSTD
jgi:hypothetical protein